MSKTNYSRSDNQKYTNQLSFLDIATIMGSWEDSIFIDRITLSITCELASAAVLSRLRYWFSPSKQDGQTRAKVIKEGKLWVAKTNEDWWDECGVTEKQIRRIKVYLKNLKLVEIKVFKFNGFPVVHWHLNIEKYVELFNKTFSKNFSDIAQRAKTILPKGQNENCPKGNIHNNRLKQYSSSLDLEKTSDKELRQRNVQLSLINENVEDCFTCEAAVYQWLGEFGFKRKKASELIQNYSANDFAILKSAVYYLREMIESSKKKNKPLDSLSGYFLKILEKGYYKPKINEDEG